MKYSERLEELRAKRGISAKELARQIGGMSESSVQRFLNGEREPRFSDAVKFAIFFGVPLSHFAEGTPEEPPDQADPDVIFLVRAWRALGISADLAARRMAGPVIGPAKPEDVEAIKKKFNLP